MTSESIGAVHHIQERSDANAKPVEDIPAAKHRCGRRQLQSWLGRPHSAREFQRAEFPGDIYPVNPKYESLLGLTAYRSIGELPICPDLAVIATPAATVPAIVRECGEKHVPGLMILSAGFREVGADGQAIETQLQAEIARFPGMPRSGQTRWAYWLPTAI